MQDLPALLTPDFGLFFWMLLAFLIVFFILKKWGFPVIIKAIEDRKQFIDESLKSAREANEKLANIQAECEALLKSTREQQSQILKEATETRNKIISDARSQAQDEGAKMIAEARTQIQAERESALRDIRSQVASISVGVAERVLQRQLSNQTEQEQFIEQLISEIEE